MAKLGLLHNARPSDVIAAGFTKPTNTDLAMDITAILDRLTTQAVGLPDKSDLSFHRTLDRGFAKSLDQTSEKLLHLTESLLATIEAGVPEPKQVTARAREQRARRTKLVDQEDVVGDFKRSVGGVIDGLLEDADSRLDEVSGQKKVTAIQINPARAATALRKLPGPFAPVAVEGASGSSTSRKIIEQLPAHIRHADISKPQLSFPDRPDPTSSAPWTPTIEVKQHAMVPLTYVVRTDDIPSPLTAPDSRTAHERRQRLRERTHPYWFETQHLPYPTRMFEIAPPIPPIPIDEASLTFVDTPEQLEAMVQELMAATEIAVDLEYHAQRSYYGFTCLMQISTRDKDWVVDTLKLRGEIRAGMLGSVMADPNIVKVFHGADSDIVWLQQDFDIYVVNLFDTYHATHVLNYPAHSLASLLARFSSFTADKRYQLADWRIRPLPQGMLEYARSDTHYLLNIYDHLRNSLLELSSRPPSPQPQVSTAETDSPGPSMPITPGPRHNPQAALRRTLELSAGTALKVYERDLYQDDGSGSGGWKFLSKKFLPKGTEGTVEGAVFRAVHRWRDDLARKLDESTHFVMPNNVLAQVALLRVPSIDLLQRINKGRHCWPGLPLDELLQVVLEARAAWTAEEEAVAARAAEVEAESAATQRPTEIPHVPVSAAPTPMDTNPAIEGSHQAHNGEMRQLRKAEMSNDDWKALAPTASRSAAPANIDIHAVWSILASDSAGLAERAERYKPKSNLFGNTVPTQSSGSPSTATAPTSTGGQGRKPASSLFGSTLPPSRPSAFFDSAKPGRTEESGFQRANRLIQASLQPSVLGDATSVAGSKPAATSPSVQAGEARSDVRETMQPEMVPFVPAERRSGFSVLKAIAAKGRAAIMPSTEPDSVPEQKQGEAEGVTAEGQDVVADTHGGAMAPAQDGQTGASVDAEQRPAKRAKDEIVKVKRTKTKVKHGKTAVLESPVLAKSGTSAAQPIEIDDKDSDVDTDSAPLTALGSDGEPRPLGRYTLRNRAVKVLKRAKKAAAAASASSSGSGSGSGSEGDGEGSGSRAATSNYLERQLRRAKKGRVGQPIGSASDPDSGSESEKKADGKKRPRAGVAVGDTAIAARSEGLDRDDNAPRPALQSAAEAESTETGTPAPKRRKAGRSIAPQPIIPTFDYSTEGNLLDQPSARAGAQDEEERNRKKSKKERKKDKKKNGDAPPPVMITTPDFGRVPRDMTQPKAGGRSKTFTS